MRSLTRRTFVAVLALVVPAARLRAFAAAPTSVDEFLELSQRLLGRSKLDREIAQIYLDAVLSNADDAVQLAYLVESNANPTPEMKALASTIIEWWYTGVYTINGAPRLATHSGALMWSALGRPAPGTCAGPFGAWSRPPDTVA
jgi:hypothetical protein